MPSRDGGLAYHKKRYATDPEYRKRAIERTRAWRKLHPDRPAEYGFKWRLAALRKYGGFPPYCACCGENELEFLSIDHVDGGGTEHRKKVGVTGQGFYRFIVKNGSDYPLQVLCYNCNLATKDGLVCPHARTPGD